MTAYTCTKAKLLSCVFTFILWKTENWFNSKFQRP